MLVSLLKELAIAAGTAAARQLVKIVRRKADDGWVDVTVTEPPPQPLTWKDVEHIRAQERASIEASKRAAVDRKATTVRPGKPDKLP